MKTVSKLLLVGLLFAFLSPDVFAARGIVAYRIKDCDYFVVYVPESYDYTLVEWFSGYDPEKGDIVYGKLDDFGFHNLSYGRRETNVWVEDYMLDKDDALERLHEQCE